MCFVKRFSICYSVCENTALVLDKIKCYFSAHFDWIPKRPILRPLNVIGTIN